MSIEATKDICWKPEPASAGGGSEFEQGFDLSKKDHGEFARVHDLEGKTRMASVQGSLLVLGMVAGRD